MGAYEVLADIESLKSIIKRHMDALRAAEAADTEMLEDLDDLERIFKKEVSVMEEQNANSNDTKEL